ncbi:glycoside hydrolase family 2 TIM barrel-domain containing protein, partial [Paenibacillus phytohabitans]
TGFYLNGEAVKLKGVSMHSDQGALGAAAHYRAMERQIEILLEMGVNAIRVTHNPAADELIEIANRKGMLIIDEAFDTWVASKNGNYNDYAAWFNKPVGDNPLLGATANMTWAELDIKTMVRRGINAPSIISWSTGNEVMEGNSGPYSGYPNILEQLATWVAEVDQTRPATIGDNKLKANWNEAISFGNKLTELDGVVGFNYADGSHFDQYHQNHPEWKMYGAETASSINSRGVYKPSNYDKHLTSYDESAVGWGKLSADSWYSIITRDFMAGEFVWTGFDYLGEPTPWNNVGSGATGGWPSPKSSYFGIVDTAGLPKDRFYFYQSQWNDEVNTLHVLPAWKEDMVAIDDKGNVRVDVYSDARSVELFFKDTNGVEKSLGKKTFTQYTTDAGHTYQVYEGSDKKSQNFRNLYLTWNVPYADGTVYAKAYD